MTGAPLRILIVAHFFEPSGETGANRPSALARHLRGAGHEVTVLTSAAYGRLPEDEELGNVRTWDLQLLPARLRGRSSVEDAFSSDTFPGPHPLSRVAVPDPQLIAWAPFGLWRALRLAGAGRFDCALTTSPPESTHLIGRALSARGVPWVADLRDGWAFEPYVKELLWPTRAQHRLNGWLERRVLTRADRLTAVTTPVVDYLRGHLGLPAELVPNGWEPGTTDDGGARDFRLEPDRVSAVYTGRLSGGRKDPRPLVSALRRLAAEDPESAAKLELVFAGSFTSEEQELFGGDCSPARIVNLGRLDRHEVAALQGRADAGLLITSASRRQESGSKLFEYIGARLPILALARPDSAAAEIVSAAGGLVVGTDDEPAITDALRHLARGEVGPPEQAIADSYAWPAVAERLVAVLRSAIAARQAASASARS